MDVAFTIYEFVKLLRERASLNVSTWVLRRNLRMLIESGVVEEVIKREFQDRSDDDDSTPK